MLVNIFPCNFIKLIHNLTNLFDIGSARIAEIIKATFFMKNIRIKNHQKVKRLKLKNYWNKLQDE